MFLCIAYLGHIYAWADANAFVATDVVLMLMGADVAVGIDVDTDGIFVVDYDDVVVVLLLTEIFIIILMLIQAQTTLAQRQTREQTEIFAKSVSQGTILLPRSIGPYWVRGLMLGYRWGPVYLVYLVPLQF